jgi:integrase
MSNERKAITPPAITAAAERAAQSGRYEVLPDPGLAGLRLRIFPSGTAVWSGQIRIGNRVRTFSEIGRHPGIGLRAARDAWRKIAHAVRYQGQDPVQARRAARRAAAPLTLDALITRYGNQAGLPASWKQQLEPAIRNRCFKPLMNRPLAQLDDTDLQACIEGWAAQRSAAFSAAALVTVLTWASSPKRKLCDPALALLEFERKGKPKERFFDRQELAALLPTLRRERAGGNAYAAALELQLLVGARISEVLNLRWSAVDWIDRTATINRSKNGKRHVIRLSAQAYVLLASLKPAEASPAGLVLPGTAKHKAQLAPAIAALQAASGVGDWTSHNMRHTAITWLQRLRIASDVIKVCVNHSATRLDGATGGYGHYDYAIEAREAMQKLADLLDRIAAGESTEVIPLRAA